MEELYEMAFGDYDEYPESVNLGVEDLWWIRLQEQTARQVDNDRDE